MSSVYDARPLAFGNSTNIRLVELLHDDDPSETTAPVSCRLHVVSFEEAPKYTALSYAWGSPKDEGTICLDGVITTIRLNLWNFLAECRRSRFAGFLWIDALCIDQNNVQERNHQVGIMGQIYRRADMVIAWLGLGYEEALNRMTEAVEDIVLEDHKGDISDKETPETAPRAVLVEYLETLSESDYWSRLWIVQEFVMNPSLELRSGRGALNIDDASQRLKDLMHSPSYLEAFNANLSSQAWRVILIRETDMKGYARYESSTLIPFFRSLKCADVRDRVFGLIGLIEEELRAYPITIDYAQSTSTLFFELVQRRQQQLDADRKEVDGDVRFYTLEYFADSLRDAFELPLDFGLEDGVPSSIFRRRIGKAKRCA